MTNLNKLCALYNIDAQKERDVLKDLLKNYLPKEYTAKVIQKLADEGVEADSQIVRNTKSAISKNILVFNAIVEVAREYHDAAKRLKNNLQLSEVNG